MTSQSEHMTAAVGQFVRVVWHDARGSATEVYARERLHKPSIMSTVGWLMDNDEAGVSLCCERSEDDEPIEYRGHTFIPRGMVQSIEPLR